MSDPFNNPPAAPGGGGKSGKDRIPAGVLAILLGSLGIHKFYLGGKSQKTAGIIMLLVTIFGSCLLFLGPAVMGVIGLIEGIMYLTKSEEEFEATYGAGDKAWF